MSVAIVNLCVDPRLSHDSVRAQIQSELQSMGLKADRIFLTNEAGGNIGSSFRNTVDMLVAIKDPIVLLAVLHHDDCKADQAGRRKPLDMTLRDLQSVASSAGFTGRVLAGSMDSTSQAIEWATDTSRPGRTYSLLPKTKSASKPPPPPPTPPNPLRRRVP